MVKNHYKYSFSKFHNYQDSDAKNKIKKNLTKQFNAGGKHQTETYTRDLNMYFGKKVSFK